MQNEIDDLVNDTNTDFRNSSDRADRHHDHDTYERAIREIIERLKDLEGKDNIDKGNNTHEWSLFEERPEKQREAFGIYEKFKMETDKILNDLNKDLYKDNIISSDFYFESKLRQNAEQQNSQIERCMLKGSVNPLEYFFKEFLNDSFGGNIKTVGEAIKFALENSVDIALGGLAAGGVRITPGIGEAALLYDAVQAYNKIKDTSQKYMKMELSRLERCEAAMFKFPSLNKSKENEYK